MRRAILAIDQGTTNTKALLIGGDDRTLAQAAQPTRVAHPRPGWAEVAAESIWRSVAVVIQRVVDQAPDTEIAAIGLANQRESALIWDRATGEALGPCVLWQCRRTSHACTALRADPRGATVQARTGLQIDPLFSATKLAWLLDQAPGARARAERGEVLGGTVDSWLLWNLTGGRHATDHSNAARTQLLSLDTCRWDPELADLFRVPLAMLPEVLSSDAHFGVTAVGATALPPGVPIHAMMGDSHAALFGHGIETPGRIKVTCGTGSSLMTPTATRPRSDHGLSATVAWSRGGEIVYALEGNITVSGEIAAFTARLLGLPDEDTLSALAASVADTDGVLFLPALAGLGAPHWLDRARGAISGMTLATKPAHLARAALEAIALQIGDVFSAAEADIGHRLDGLSIDGGASRNDVLMQMVADLLDRPVARPAQAEISAFGVARMAAEGVGLHLATSQGSQSEFNPKMADALRDYKVGVWRSLVAQVAASAQSR